jgi:hypothetical protein
MLFEVAPDVVPLVRVFTLVSVESPVITFPPDS